MHCEICLEGTNPEAVLPRISWIKAFVHTVQAGSVSGGAADMGIGGPAVSVAITRLEEHLGEAVIERKSTIRPTKLGSALLPTYQRILWLLETTSGK